MKIEELHKMFDYCEKNNITEKKYCELFQLKYSNLAYYKRKYKLNYRKSYHYNNLKITIKKGQKFGKLTIIKETVRKNKDKRRFLCICECGNEKEVDLINLTMKNTISCGCYIPSLNRKRTGEASPTWKTGSYINEDGYKFIRKPKHPNSKSSGYISEHRYIMSKYLNRALNKKENVHHINGNKLDNRIENLELWSTSQPCGQRVSDKIVWSKEILKLYGKNEKKYKQSIP